MIWHAKVCSADNGAYTSDNGLVVCASGSRGSHRGQHDQNYSGDRDRNASECEGRHHSGPGQEQVLAQKTFAEPVPDEP